MQSADSRYSYPLHAFKKNSIGEINGRAEITFFQMDKNKGRELYELLLARWLWSFSVNPAEVEKVISYIANQKKHHNKKTFQDEYRAFLKKYEVEYDEQYVWS